MSWIHGFTGEKGGVGKSLVALAAAEYLLQKGKRFIVCETDRSNGDVGRAFDNKHEVIRPYFVEDSDEIDSADELLDVALGGADIIVNTPAQSHRAIAKWLSLGSAELAIEDGVKFCFWFVTSGEQDSINLFLESLKAFDGIPHVLVRNQHFTDRLTYDYSDPDTWEPIKEAIATYNVPIINFPKITPGDNDYIRAHSLTFGEAITNPEGLRPAARSRVKRVITSFGKQLDALEVFKNEQPAKREPEFVPESDGGKKRGRTTARKGSNGRARNPKG